MNKIDKIEEWIKNADFDGRGILFKFTDKDAEELKELVNEWYTQQLREIKELGKKINKFERKVKKLKKEGKIW